MENLQKEKMEAVEAVGEYLGKLIPGMQALCGELRGNRQPDTDDFRKQCMDGLNWVIEIYNRTADVLDGGKIQEKKEELNAGLLKLGEAMKNREDEKTAQLLEEVVLPFLDSLKKAAAERRNKM